jgi:hypothetical protein
MATRRRPGRSSPWQARPWPWARDGRRGADASDTDDDAGPEEATKTEGSHASGQNQPQVDLLRPRPRARDGHGGADRFTKPQRQRRDGEEDTSSVGPAGSSQRIGHVQKPQRRREIGGDEEGGWTHLRPETAQSTYQRSAPQRCGASQKPANIDQSTENQRGRRNRIQTAAMEKHGEEPQVEHIVLSSTKAARDTQPRRP